MFGLPKVQPARSPEEVDKRIELWHDMDDERYLALGQPSLNDYLGWSEKEYGDWLFTGRIPG